MNPLLTAAVGGGITGLLGFIFFPYIQIARGLLVPRSALDDQIAEKETWRTAYEKSEEARGEESKTGLVVRHFFESLSRGADL